MSNSSRCDCECKKACKIDKYLDIKNYSRKQRLFRKLVLAMCIYCSIEYCSIQLGGIETFYPLGHILV